MTYQIALTLGILGAAILLFLTNRVRVDLVALLVLLAVLVTGLVTPADAFSGFSNSAVITVWAMFIISGGLFYTGVANWVGDRLLRLAGKSHPRLVGLLMTATASLSLTMNNIGATAVLLPAAVSVSRKAKVNASRLLIPLAFGSFLGGMATLFGTPSNLLAGNALREAGLQSFTILNFAPPGLIAAVLGVTYMALAGYRLLPDRTPAERLAEGAGPEVDLGLYQLGERVFRARIPTGSPLIGKTLAESGLRHVFDLSVIALVHQGETRLAPGRLTVLHQGDILLVEGMMDNLAWAQEAGQLEMQPELGLRDEELRSDMVGIAEAILSPHTHLVGKTLRDIQFRDKYHLTVLAIFQGGHPRRTRLPDIPLQFGDTLLVQGQRQSLRMLQREPDFVVVGAVEAAPILRPRKAPLAAALLLVMIVPAVAGWLPVAAAAVLAAVLMVITGCLTMDEAYQSIAWRSVFLVAGMLPLGIAMQKTGTAQLLAEGMLHVVGNLGPIAVLAGFFVITNLLTQFISSVATVVLVAPIAIGVAQSMGGNPQAVMMAVAMAAVATFLTPVAHQANVMVMGLGGYRFSDYLKSGLPLDLITLAVVLIVVPLLWPWR